MTRRTQQKQVDITKLERQLKAFATGALEMLKKAESGVSMHGMSPDEAKEKIKKLFLTEASDIITRLSERNPEAALKASEDLLANPPFHDAVPAIESMKRATIHQLDHKKMISSVHYYSAARTSASLARLEAHVMKMSNPAETPKVLSWILKTAEYRDEHKMDPVPTRWLKGFLGTVLKNRTNMDAHISSHFSQKLTKQYANYCVATVKDMNGANISPHTPNGMATLVIVSDMQELISHPPYDGAAIDVGNCLKGIYRHLAQKDYENVKAHIEGIQERNNLSPDLKKIIRESHPDKWINSPAYFAKKRRVNCATGIESDKREKQKPKVIGKITLQRDPA